jgi:hypothetical protein
MRWLRPVAAGVCVFGAAVITAPGQVSTAIPHRSNQPLASNQSVGVSVVAAPYIVVSPEEAADRYSCVIRIDATSDEAGNVHYFSDWFDSQSAVALLSSSALIDPAVKRMLDLSPAQRWEQVVVNVTAAGPRLARLEVVLRKSAQARYPEDGARKTADELLDRLKRAYEASAAAGRKAAEARLKPIADELAATSARYGELRQRQRLIRARAADAEVNSAYPAQAGDQLANLRSQHRILQADATRNEARLAALQPPPPQTSQWEQIVKTRQNQVDELKARAKENKATTEQVQDAESRLADAQAELEQARQPQSVNTGNRAMESQIAGLKATLADERVRLAQMDQQIAKIGDSKLQVDIESLPDLQNREYQERNKVNDLQIRLDAVRRLAEQEPVVTVTVLDGSAR